MVESYIRILYAIHVDFIHFLKVKSKSKSYIKKKYTSRKGTNDLVIGIGSPGSKLGEQARSGFLRCLSNSDEI